MEVFYFKNAMIQKLEIQSVFARDNKVKLTLRFEDDVPSVVCGDRKTFELLFMNLLSKTISVLSNTKLRIYCRLRGIINSYQDFTIQIIMTYILQKGKIEKPVKILENSIKKPKSNCIKTFLILKRCTVWKLDK